MFRRNAVIAFVGLVLVAGPCTAQQLSKRMTNKDVIEMVQLGLPDDVIIDKIQTAGETAFDTSVAGLKALKEAKVSNDVIRAMVHPHATGAPAVAVPVPPEPEAETAEPAEGTVRMAGGLPREIGVYVLRKGRLAEVEPEIVGWQTGGAVKHIATLGLDKGHVNGTVMNPKSHLQLGTPVVFVIKTPEGTSATEYQLLNFYLKENRREFRATTGGIVHASGGAERNNVNFSPEKVGDRVWRIVLKDLPKGEYGFLPPGVSSASMASSGKIYTFGVTE